MKNPRRGKIITDLICLPLLKYRRLHKKFIILGSPQKSLPRPTIYRPKSVCPGGRRAMRIFTGKLLAEEDFSGRGRFYNLTPAWHCMVAHRHIGKSISGKVWSLLIASSQCKSPALKLNRTLSFEASPIRTNPFSITSRRWPLTLPQAASRTAAVAADVIRLKKITELDSEKLLRHFYYFYCLLPCRNK